MKQVSEEIYVHMLDKTFALFESDAGVPWIYYKHPDGGWVSYKEATQSEIWQFKITKEANHAK